MHDYFNPVRLASLQLEPMACRPDFYLGIATPVQYSHFRQELSEFVCLPDNWDG